MDLTNNIPFSPAKRVESMEKRAARMRYPEAALSELRKIDPDTSITLNYIRTLVASGKIPCHRIGRRRLINFDALLEYLAKAEDEDQSTTPTGVIRRLPEKPGRMA